jgi:hypothetical protein
MTDRLPPRLREVSTVGVYSPSGAFADDPHKLALYEAGLAQLRGLGLTVVEAEHTRGAWHHASGTAQDRVADLRQLLNHPEVDLILPSIGGHVTSQMLPLLDVEEIADSGKALLGFSDNALLPLVLADRTGTIGVHHGADVPFWFGRFAEGLYPLTLRSFTETIRGRPISEGPRPCRGVRGLSAAEGLCGVVAVQVTRAAIRTAATMVTVRPVLRLRPRRPARGRTRPAPARRLTHEPGHELAHATTRGRDHGGRVGVRTGHAEATGDDLAVRGLPHSSPEGLEPAVQAPNPGLEAPHRLPLANQQVTGWIGILRPHRVLDLDEARRRGGLPW